MRIGGRIENNIIKDNHAGSDGGGLSFHCDGTIQNNFISNNYSISGGGISRCHGVIQNNLIAGNIARGNYREDNHVGGGGLYGCDAIIRNNTIVNNICERDAAVGLSRCEGTIINNIIWGNEAPNYPQIYGSSTPEYCLIENWSQIDRGNLKAAPEFMNPEANDFRLRPGSPGIDAGKEIESLMTDTKTTRAALTATGQGQGPTGDGSDYDMGAYEYVPFERVGLWNRTAGKNFSRAARFKSVGGRTSSQPGRPWRWNCGTAKGWLRY